MESFHLLKMMYLRRSLVDLKYPGNGLTFLFMFPFLSYLVAAAGLQSLWSLVLAIVDAYALLVGRRLQNPRVVILFAVGDGVRLFSS